MLVDDAYQDKYYRIEEAHAWSVSRRDVLLRMMRAWRVSPSASVLDVGCSGGAFVELLRREGWDDVHGVDVSERAIDVARGRGMTTCQRVDGTDLPYDDQRFDCLVASDVLEHIPDDEAALREWRRVLVPDGVAIIFVPAWPFLWSEHDEINEHQRRYTKPLLAERVRAAGFEVERAGYWNLALFFPTAAMRLAAKVLPKRAVTEAPVDDFKELNPISNGIFTTLMMSENRVLSRSIDFPIGVSTFVVARRRG